MIFKNVFKIDNKKWKNRMKKDNLNNVFEQYDVQKCQKINKYTIKIYKINKSSGQIQRNVLD